MYLNFAWRYFKAKKSANAINIIAWVTVGVIAFATCCQVLVLSVFNGFEGLVKSLYSSFYTDLRVVPEKGKTFTLSPSSLQQVRNTSGIQAISMIVQEKALLQNGEAQSVVQLKGVDENFAAVSGVPEKVVRGQFNLGTRDEPALLVGIGIQQAAAISLQPAFGPDNLTLILPRNKSTSNDPLESLSEGNAVATGVFSIQQDFDNSYALTNIDFVKQQTGLSADEYSLMEIKLAPAANMEKSKRSIQQLLGKKFSVQTRYEQNSNLYSTMQLEKWAIYAILTLILVIAAFNMISALTMLVLEKKQDIAILQSMGAAQGQVKKIFLAEGILLGCIGTALGIGLAVLICLLQLKYKWIKLQGGSFLLDYFPVKFLAADFILVISTALAITIIASWLPAKKAASQQISLR
ncbi:MAG: FtsX-like permease family protein [Sphingobacteriales bacterium]|jgi:lipoprotein-releasing system permease protein|nr:FtsX-like permease family protein [Sphingobacteriales bacterium]